MKDCRFIFGCVVSVVWILLMVLMIYQNPDGAKEMKLNEWGDYFAGFFAPIAFLWLVLGFLQQGQELQLSTRALELQAEELRNSVEQQRQLVEITRLQVDSELEALRQERESRREAARPKFIIRDPGASFTSGVARYTTSIKNIGNTATELVFTFSPDLKFSSLTRVLSCIRSEELSWEFENSSGQADQNTTLTITYLDSDGLPGEARFCLVPVQSDNHKMVKITRET